MKRREFISLLGGAAAASSLLCSTPRARAGSSFPSIAWSEARRLFRRSMRPKPAARRRSTCSRRRFCTAIGARSSCERSSCDCRRSINGRTRRRKAGCSDTDHASRRCFGCLRGNWQEPCAGQIRPTCRSNSPPNSNWPSTNERRKRPASTLMPRCSPAPTR
jgi:hypothetical protein